MQLVLGWYGRTRAMHKHWIRKVTQGWTSSVTFPAQWEEHFHSPTHAESVLTWSPPGLCSVSAPPAASPLLHPKCCSRTSCEGDRNRGTRSKCSTLSWWSWVRGLGLSMLTQTGNLSMVVNGCYLYRRYIQSGCYIQHTCVNCTEIAHHCKECWK